MRRRLWLALDRAAHALPLLRFGRVRYAICLRADRYMEEDDFDQAMAAGTPVAVSVSPTLRIISSSPSITASIPTSGSGSSMTWTYR